MPDEYAVEMDGGWMPYSSSVCAQIESCLAAAQVAELHLECEDGVERVIVFDHSGGHHMQLNRRTGGTRRIRVAHSGKDNNSPRRKRVCLEVPDIIEWQYLDGGGKHDREWTCYSPADNEALEKAFQSENVTVVLQVFFAPENPTPKPHTHPRRCCTQNTK